MSNQATQYRALLYVSSMVGLFCFYVAYKGSRGLLAPAMGVALALTGIVCFLAGAWFGWKGARIRIAEREKKAEAIALVTLAAFLKDRSDEELKATVAKGGQAGEAAKMVLERRRHGLNQAGRRSGG